MGLDCRQALPPSPAPALTWEGCASRSFQKAELPVGRLGAPGQGLPSCRVQSRGGRASWGLSAQALPSAGPTRRGWRPSWAFPGPSHGVPATRLLLGFLVPLSIKGLLGAGPGKQGPGSWTRVCPCPQQSSVCVCINPVTDDSGLQARPGPWMDTGSQTVPTACWRCSPQPSALKRAPRPCRE